MNEDVLFGEGRKRLLRCLLRCKEGASIDQLVESMGVTRTAVRQRPA